MSDIEESIDVDVPISTAYNQWTQFEDFPRFMEGVEEVTQLGDRSLKWVAEIGGQQREWIADITEQVPDQRIAWKSRDGAMHAGIVAFEPLDAARTRVRLLMAYDPETFVEKAGDVLGFVRRRVQGDLQRFKDFIEERGVETGAWRGEIRQPGLG